MSIFKPGDIITVEVKRIESFAVFVESEKIKGIIQISEITNKNILHPEKTLSIGQRIQGKIKFVDFNSTRDEKFSLSLKDTEEYENPWLKCNLSISDVVKCTIIGATSYGYRVFLENKIYGALKTKNKYRLGQKLSLVVKKIDYNIEKIILTDKFMI